MRIPQSQRAAIGLINVAALGLDRRAARGLALEERSIPELGEQALLEAAQDRALLRSGGKAAQRFAVEVEQELVRIVARQQAQEELVQVEAAHQAASSQRLDRARPFGGDEVAELARAAPAQAQRVEGKEHAAHRRARPARAARDHRDAAVGAREGLHDEAGFHVRVRVQHVAGLVVYASFHPYPNWRRMRASSVQALRTFTQVPRYTLPPKGFSMSLRAAVAMRFRRPPPAPRTIGFWLSRSTRIVASMRRRRPSSLKLSTTTSQR